MLEQFVSELGGDFQKSQVWGRSGRIVGVVLGCYREEDAFPVQLGHGVAVFECVQAKREGKPIKKQNVSLSDPLHVRVHAPLCKFLQGVKLHGLPVDFEVALHLLDLLELVYECLDHCFCAVHFVVLSRFAQSRLDDVACE